MRVILKLEKERDGKKRLSSKTINYVADNANNDAILAMAGGFAKIINLNIPEVHKVSVEVLPLQK